MSQYGRVNPNYYNPVAKFNTFRPAIYYSAFFDYILVFNYCQQLIEELELPAQLPYESINANCLQLVETIYSWFNNITFNVLTATSCNVQFNDVSLVNYSPTYLQNNITIVNNFCNLNITTLVIPTQTVNAAPAYSPGLYQEVVTTFCQQTISTPTIPNLEYYSTDNSYCFQSVQTFIVGTLPLEILTVTACETTPQERTITIDSTYLANNIINITTTCNLDHAVFI